MRLPWLMGEFLTRSGQKTPPCVFVNHAHITSLISFMSRFHYCLQRLTTSALSCSDNFMLPMIVTLSKLSS